MKEKTLKLLYHYASNITGAKTAKDVGANERLQSIQKLLVDLRARKNKPFAVRDVAPEILRDLSGGSEFDAINVTIKNDDAKQCFAIVIHLFKDKKLLRRWISCTLQYDGSPRFLTESDTHTLSHADDLSYGMLEGKARAFSFAGAASPERELALGRLNSILQLATKRPKQRGYSKN